jgi:hypothetical protein
METETLARMLADAAQEEQTRARVMEEQADRESRRRIPGGNALSQEVYEAVIAQRLTAEQEQALYEARVRDLQLKAPRANHAGLT